MNVSPGAIEQLIARIESLERRVSALEHSPEEPVESAASLPGTTQPLLTSPATTLDSVSVFSVLGRAMLGVAGAYLLRAAAESTLLPSAIAAAIAIPYAVAWLVFAVRVRAGEWFPATVYSVTSAVILAPMLWELTFRFQILSAPAGAAMIAVYITAATALAWRRNLTPVFWVANIAATLIALGLFFASRTPTPLVSVLLLMLVFASVAESRTRAPGLRALTALAASLALWASVYVYISPPGTRPDYPPLNPAALIIPTLILLALYLASVVYNTIGRRLRITVFEILQTVIAFLLVAVALDAFGPRSSLLLFGIFCLALGAASYAAVYLFFDRIPQPRNYRVFSTWSAALILIGCSLALSDSFQTPSLSLAAIAATVLGARFSRFVLVFHGAAYLAAAAAASGLAAYTLSALAGAFPSAPAWPIYLAFLAAVLCYSVVPRPSSPSWQQQTIQLLFAALAICTASALLVHLFMGLAALRIQTGPHHLAFFRTVSLCSAALTLAYAGARFKRIELTRIANAVLVLLAVKLVAEDLRHGRLAYIAGSIFLFALTLIAVPRAARAARRPHSHPLSPSA
jgi:hypothetical protein